MYKENQANLNPALGVLTGLLIGGLAGAGAMLLLAPQSGEKTRKQILAKGIELRDQTTGMIEDATAKVWLTKKRITRDGRRKAQELLHHGQEMVGEKIGNVSEVAKTWKKSVLHS